MPDARRYDPAQSIGAGLGTARCHRTQCVKLARTIADLAGSEEIQSVHLTEALHAAQPTEVDAEPSNVRRIQE